MILQFTRHYTCTAQGIDSDSRFHVHICTAGRLFTIEDIRQMHAELSAFLHFLEAEQEDKIKKGGAQ